MSTKEVLEKRLKHDLCDEVVVYLGKKGTGIRWTTTINGREWHDCVELRGRLLNPSDEGFLKQLKKDSIGVTERKIAEVGSIGTAGE